MERLELMLPRSRLRSPAREGEPETREAGRLGRDSSDILDGDF